MPRRTSSVWTPPSFEERTSYRRTAFPTRPATGFVYDSGNYERALDLALEKAGYNDLKRERQEARKQGKLIGVGSPVSRRWSERGRPSTTISPG